MIKHAVGWLLAGWVSCYYWSACTTPPGNNPQRLADGRKAAETYCKGCHLLPRPSDLDKNTWLNHVLPAMGQQLGFTSMGMGRYYHRPEAAMPPETWDNLVYYYYNTAPDTLPLPARGIPAVAGPFAFTYHPLPPATYQPATTCVQWLGNGAVAFADGRQQKVYIAAKGQTDSLASETGVSHIRAKDGRWWFLSMGVLYPSNAALGKLQVVQAGRPAITLIDSLLRPVDAAYADMNNDGREDVMIAEFGNTTGALNWYQKLPSGQYKKHTLRSLPGAVQVAVFDFNKDGLPDIAALMAQGDEGVFIYYNRGKGVFDEQRVLQFPPSYGCNSMQLADVNNDGAMDLVTTNGDNGDYPPVLKPYHGVRIFLNNGGNQFIEKWFLPQNGAGKVIVADFDNDGDVDLASTSYFPNYTHLPAEAFLLWENINNRRFIPYTHPAALPGRWLVMNAADADGDGDVDIILGHAAFTLGNVPTFASARWQQNSPAGILVNHQK